MTLPNWAEVDAFLAAIGRAEGLIVFAIYPPTQDQPCIHITGDADDPPRREIQRALAKHPTHSLGVVINPPLPIPQDWGSLPEHLNRAGKPKAWGASTAHIAFCVAIWYECDGSLPIDAQAALPAMAGLPEPSISVWSGGKSLHHYWVFTPGEELTPELFTAYQKRLAHAILTVAPDAQVDPALSNPNRVMRVPGGFHPGTGKQATIHSNTGATYSAAEIDAILPLIPGGNGTSKGLGPNGTGGGRRTLWFQQLTTTQQLAAAVDMLRSIPPRQAPGTGTYPEAFATLAALVHTFGQDQAIAICEQAGWANEHWDPAVKARTIGPARIQARIGAVVAKAEQYGWQPPDDLPAIPPPQSAQDAAMELLGVIEAPAKPKVEKFKPRPDSTARWGKVRLSLNRRIDAFQHCIHALTLQERNSLRRMARVRHALLALELKTAINPKEVGQMVLEQLDERTGNRFAPLTAADRAAMPIPTVEWEIPGCIPRQDLTIIGGRAKVGKTRLANALVRCLLLQEDFLGFGPPPELRTVILVTDDQGDGDTAEMLQQLQLWHHPRLIWSRRFRVTESNLDGLLGCITANPGAVVILDSLRSITRSTAFSENDPEMGGLIYDLKGAIVDAGGTLLLIHHCNKGNDSTGTEALSGHNAIAGAANCILTLHYMAKGARLQKDSPQRRMVREARSGPPADLVLAFEASTGAFLRVGDYDAVVDAEQDTEKSAAQFGGDLAKAPAEVKDAMRFLHTVYSRGGHEMPGLLDICKAIGAAPIGSQRLSDLTPDETTRYKRIGRALGSCSELVAQEKVPTKNGYFISYALTDAGVEALRCAGLS